MSDLLTRLNTGLLPSSIDISAPWGRRRFILFTSLGISLLPRDWTSDDFLDALSYWMCFNSRLLQVLAGYTRNDFLYSCWKLFLYLFKICIDSGCIYVAFQFFHPFYIQSLVTQLSSLISIHLSFIGSGTIRNTNLL